MWVYIKNIALIFGLLKAMFFYIFFSTYKMVDSEYSTGNYMSSKASIKAVIKNPDILKFVLDHLKT